MNPNPNLFKKGHTIWVGRKHSLESKLKMSCNSEGKKGRKVGFKHSKETIAKMKESLSDEKHYNWKGGITPLNKKIRGLEESLKWRKYIFERDNHTCQECFLRGVRLEAHHKKPFKVIFEQFLQEFNQFSPLEDAVILSRIAINYKPFWDLTNGITLCKKCHKVASLTKIVMELQ